MVETGLRIWTNGKTDGKTDKDTSLQGKTSSSVLGTFGLGYY